MTPEQKARTAEYARAYRAANAEKITEQGKAYYAANAERVAECKRAYYAANLEKMAERSRAYYAATVEKRAEYKKGYYAANTGKIAERLRTHSASVSDGYVCNRLRMPFATIPPELIELKRALLLGHRIQRSLKKEIENEPHRPNER